MRGNLQRLRRGMLVAFVLALALPAAPAAAQSSKPTVTTGGIANLTPSSVTLLGKVAPNGAETTYLFQYGPTTLYGSSTAPAVIAGGAGATNVTANVVGLSPFTTYHYRLVARNRNGTTEGAAKAFKTKRQPLGLTLAAQPNPVAFGKPVVLSGMLTGTGNSGREIQLQSNPFPYTQGFAATGNVLLTDAQGAFAFTLPSLASNTQFRVLIPSKTEVMSPIIIAGVAPRIGTLVTRTRVRRGQRVRFFGTVKPGRAGYQFAIQKRSLRRGWVNVAGGITRAGSAGSARYGKTVRVLRGGQYRVFVSVVDGHYASHSGRTVTIRTLPSG